MQGQFELLMRGLPYGWQIRLAARLRVTRGSVGNYIHRRRNAQESAAYEDALVGYLQERSSDYTAAAKIIGQPDPISRQQAARLGMIAPMNFGVYLRNATGKSRHSVSYIMRGVYQCSPPVEQAIRTKFATEILPAVREIYTHYKLPPPC